MKAGRELDVLVAEKVMGIDLTAHDDESIGRAAFSGLDATYGNGTATVTWSGVTYERIAMGAAFNDGARGNAGHSLYWWRNRDGKSWQKDLEAQVATWRDSPQHYSTDIAAAWLVLDHFGDTMRRLLWNRGSGGWECVIDCDHAVRAETAPLAICLAALKAVGVEVEGEK